MVIAPGWCTSLSQAQRCGMSACRSLACTSADSRLALCSSRQAWLMVILPRMLDNACCFSAISACRDASSAEAFFASICSDKYHSVT